ncbi:hypothetical protein OSB04_un000192 [Centaurea solstitialis]|uniref:Reverse transcriptase domain-containing protein n=1 Tax=Centaurea solstitialis TaxID=347529 RepID=A0AA38SD55_9ASTR|nr:hypothetical protein OSB04_un000192 [Centaurea solstitialis]
MDAMDQIIAKEVEIKCDSVVREKTQRASVFDRLNIDERLKHSEPSSLNYAKAVGSGVGDSSLTFYPLVDKTQSKVRIPEVLAKHVMDQHRSTLFGYFLGPRLHFPIVEEYAKKTWGKFGFSAAMMNSNGFYFFKFNDIGGAKQVIENGPLMIRGVPLFVDLWDPSQGLSKPMHNTCPLWVKLHNIPLVAFNKEGIGRIASALGVPKQMDACTSSMCDKAWGRPGFAKVLVEVWAVGELKRELQVVIPGMNGAQDATVVVQVEYIWEPIQCQHCMVFGHKASTCVKAMRAAKPKENVMDDQGFTTVKRKEWRQKQGAPAKQTTQVEIVEPSKRSESELDKGVSPENTKHAELKKQQHQRGGIEGQPSHGKSPTLGQKPGRLEEPKKMVTNDLSGKEKQLKLKGILKHRPLIPEVSDAFKTFQPRRGVVINEPSRAQQNRFSSLSDFSEDDSTPILEEVSQEMDKGGMNEVVSSSLESGCWNIRGLNSPVKRKEVKNFIHSNGLALCGIVESKVDVLALNEVCSSTFGVWSWISNSGMCNGGTRIICAWDPRHLDVMLIESHAQFMHCQVFVKGSPIHFFVSLIYGANSYGERRLLWSGLRKFKVFLGNNAWIAMGDFNSMLFPHDGLGGSSKRDRDMEDFMLCVEDVDIFDCRYGGIQYTWVQKPNSEGGIMRKLDRIMVNSELLSIMGDAEASFLSRGISDHAPGIISFKGGHKPKLGGFKFDNFLVSHPMFHETIRNVWRTDFGGCFIKRVEFFRKEFEIAQLHVDSDPFNVGFREDLAHISLAFQQACLDEEDALRQRAKIHSLNEGDGNTKYFHHVMREKRHFRRCTSIIDANGQLVQDDDVPKAFVDYYKSLMGELDVGVVPEMHPSWFDRRLTLHESLAMLDPITDVEIKKAMFAIGNDKAPGSDGFSSKFFKAAWSEVGGDVEKGIHEFFYRSRMLVQLNHTLICLIPKSSNASKVVDFRPISCCNVLFKCISKIVSDRIKGAFDGLVNRAQSAFIPGRRISDNILLAHELVNGYQKNGGSPRCAFKIDIRKAYDMVSWSFILSMLNGLGFHPAIVRWIEEIISTVSYSVAVNGVSEGFFQAKRGIRQGDPLSPYLFTLVMEGFSLILQRCINEAAEFGYHYGCEELGISHLCFADDLFVFTKGDIRSVEVLKRALAIFRSKSGLEPSLEKSEVFFGNVDAQTKEAIVLTLPFRNGVFPIRSILSRVFYVSRLETLSRFSFSKVENVQVSVYFSSAVRSFEETIFRNFSSSIDKSAARTFEKSDFRELSKLTDKDFRPGNALTN